MSLVFILPMVAVFGLVVGSVLSSTLLGPSFNTRGYTDIDDGPCCDQAGTYHFCQKNQKQVTRTHTNEDFEEYNHAVQELIETGKYKTECPEPVMQYLLPLVTNLYDSGYISDVEKEMGGGFVSVKVTWKVKAKH